MKLGIIVDSACGLTQEQANQRNWGFAPIIVSIDGHDYEDGISINGEQFYKMINIDMDLKTATTPLGKIKDILESFAKNYDQVLVYPLSKGLSKQAEHFAQEAEKFPNVFVVPSQAVGTAIVSDCEILEKMAQSNYAWQEIKNHALQLTKAQFGLAIPETMKWLVKGGRVSGPAASMAKLIKIVPIIQIKDGKLEKFDKGRVFEKTVRKIAKYLRNNYYQKNKNYQFSIYHGNNEKIEKFSEDIKEFLPVSNISLFPPIIGSHIGPGVIAIIAHLKN